MQNADAGKKSTSRSDEESINFRPSPNFKHMKKYLKSKFEETSGIENSNEGEKSNISQNEMEEEKQQVKTSPTTPPPTTTSATTMTTTIVQPPLPPNPPPPDSPVREIKQELIDEDYLQYSNIANNPNNEDVYGQYTTTMVPEQEITTKSSEPEVTMCRNFVRGTCKKGAACIFAHELILSQLPGVYTFCRNFQNRQCTFDKCKFVHATVFEKEYFYRTGYLPPHTIKHLKALPQQPPPPPPPEETTPPPPEMPEEEYYTETPMDESVTPMSNITMEFTAIPSYLMESTLGAASDPMLYAAGTSTATTTNPSLKRDWSTTFLGEESVYSAAEAELGTAESLPKKCKNCDSNEFRFQYHKNKFENMMTAKEDVNKKLAQLNEKNQRLCIVLMTLFKPQQTTTPAPGLSTLTSALEDKDENILEQMNLLMGNNNRTPSITEEDTMKNILASNVNFQLMAKLFMSAAEQPPPQ